ncbi:hypothetical protein JCM8547_003145 [Rhodosporidiobolus lusitaniae]
MKAWVFRKTGEPQDILKLEQDYEKPKPGKGQVLLRVHAASLNPVGWKAMGMAPLRWMQKTPGVPENDVAGVIEGGDTSGCDYNVGDAVFGLVPADQTMKTGKGVLAEYTLADKNLVVKKPDNVSFEEASSFPLTTFTSFWAMQKVGGLKKGAGTRFFINGGSGGVGVYAVQLAKAYGAYVVTTCSPPSRSLVESLGPDEIIDYKSANLVDQLAERFGVKEKPFDIVFDTVGHNAELYYQSARFLSPKGVFVDIAGPHMDGSASSLLTASLDFAHRLFRPTWLGGVPRRYVFGMMKPTKENLVGMQGLIRDGKLKPVIDEVFPFEAALRAYDRQKGGRSKGKVVVSVAQ